MRRGGCIVVVACALLGCFQRLFGARTETADTFNGYMDGAVRSGERAAAEVAHRL